jgi:hypothetical protein
MATTQAAKKALIAVLPKDWDVERVYTKWLVADRDFGRPRRLETPLSRSRAERDKFRLPVIIFARLGFVSSASVDFRVGGLLHKRLKLHLVVGQCEFLGSVDVRNPTLPLNSQ